MSTTPKVVSRQNNWGLVGTSESASRKTTARHSVGDTLSNVLPSVQSTFCRRSDLLTTFYRMTMPSGISMVLFSAINQQNIFLASRWAPRKSILSHMLRLLPKVYEGYSGLQSWIAKLGNTQKKSLGLSA